MLRLLTKAHGMDLSPYFDVLASMIANFLEEFGLSVII